MKKVKKHLISGFWGLALFCVIYWLLFLFNPAIHYRAMGNLGSKLGYNAFAIEKLSVIIRLNANNAGAFNQRGVCRYNLGQLEEAIKDYDRAIELDPQFSMAIKNRAVALLYLAKADEAKKGFALACKLGSCADFTPYCSELKNLCDMGICKAFQAAVSIDLCPKL